MKHSIPTPYFQNDTLYLSFLRKQESILDFKKMDSGSFAGMTKGLFFSFVRPRLMKLVFSLFLLFIFFTITPPAFAYDLTITCGDSSCTKDVNSPLFSPTDIWYPGYSATRTIHFINNSSDSRSLTTQAINSTQTGDIDTVMLYTMRQSGAPTNLWSNTLRQFYNESFIGLPTLSSNGTFDLEITIGMDSGAGNEFQNKETTFDLIFTVADDIKVTVQALNGSSGGGGTGGTDTTPQTTTNLITQLTALPQIFLPAANPDIAGDATENPPEPEVVNLEEEGKVSGATTCQTCTWWQLLVIQLILTLWLYRRQQGSKKKIWMGGAFIGLLTYAVFLFINRSCRNGWELWIDTASIWCKYFFVWVLFIFSLCSYFFLPKKPTDTPTGN